MKQFSILIIASTIALLTFAQKKSTDIKGRNPIQWLEGSWKGMSGDKPFYEAWKFFNDSVIVNFEITINNDDTVIRKSGAIILKQNQKYFGNNSIQWKISRITANEIVLKNDSLPYSNTIIWLHTKEDHWFTILENPGTTVYYDLVRDPALDRKVVEWIRLNRK